MKENRLKNIWLSTGTGFKLTLAVCATALLTISVFAYVNIRTHSASLLAEVERHANQLSESVRLSTEYDMLLNHRERLHESIRRVGNQRSIQRIRVMNKAGRIIYSSDAAEIGRMVDQKGESCYMCHAAGRPLERLEIKDRTRVFRPGPGSSRILGTITPIYNAPSCWTAACHAHPREKVVLGVLDVTMPLAEVDKDIRRGQPLFNIRQKNRSAQFQAPVSGKVVKINQALGEDCGALALTPYYGNWVCVIEGDNLDAEVSALKIGKSAVALFQEDLEKFRAAMQRLAGSGAVKARLDGAVYAGELEHLDEANWENMVKEFFRK